MQLKKENIWYFNEAILSEKSCLKLGGGFGGGGGQKNIKSGDVHIGGGVSKEGGFKPSTHYEVL